MNARALKVLCVLLIAFSTRAGAQPRKPVVPLGNLLDSKIVPAACCVVTAIDLIKGIVSGRETATGYTFKFVVLAGIMSAQDSSKLVRSITINQKVWASLQGKGVKVYYDRPICCGITEEADH